MDLVQTIRKEGSRGGVNFSWDDVKSSTHRENYLGHSLMAPVGRWQKGKDLNWYARAEDAELTPEQRAEKERERKREEMRKIKEAEEDAMARAMGLPVPDRSNANLEPLGLDKVKQKEVNQALKEVLKDDSEEEAGRKTLRTSDGKLRRDGSPRRRDHRRSAKHRHRSRSRDRSRDRERRHRQKHRDHRDRGRSSSPSRSRSRTRSPMRTQDRRRHRSKSRENRDNGGRKSDRYERNRSHSRERTYRSRNHRSRSRSPYHARDRRRHDSR